MRRLRRTFFELSYLLGRAPWDSGISPPELLAFVETHSPGRALDLGCGTGTNAITLARHGWQVIGIDFASRAIRQARRKARAGGVAIDFRQGDVANLDTVQVPLDLVLDIGCYHSLPAAIQSRYAVGVERLLRPGGTLLLYGLLRRNPKDPSTWLIDDAVAHRFGSSFEVVSAVAGTDRQRPSIWLTLGRRP